jgi:hypothetical protein
MFFSKSMAADLAAVALRCLLLEHLSSGPARKRNSSFELRLFQKCNQVLPVIFGTGCAKHSLLRSVLSYGGEIALEARSTASTIDHQFLSLRRP